MTENKKIVVSPCISICQYDQENTCMGCYRTKEERLKWKDQDSTSQWKEENLQAIKQRMPEAHLQSWNETYNKKRARILSREKP